MEGRKQAVTAARFIAEEVPGCASARLQALATGIGIRETRRVKGRTIISVEDLRSGRIFPDTIGMSAFPIDIHHSNENFSTIERLGERSALLP